MAVNAVRAVSPPHGGDADYIIALVNPLHAKYPTKKATAPV